MLLLDLFEGSMYWTGGKRGFAQHSYLELLSFILDNGDALVSKDKAHQAILKKVIQYILLFTSNFMFQILTNLFGKLLALRKAKVCLKAVFLVNKHMPDLSRGNYFLFIFYFYFFFGVFFFVFKILIYFLRNCPRYHYCDKEEAVEARCR